MERNEDIQRARLEGTVYPRWCHEKKGKECKLFPIYSSHRGREGGEEAKKEKRAETRLDLHLGGAPRASNQHGHIGQLLYGSAVR